MPTAESMPLSVFIERHHSEIIGEFSAFARTLMPSGSAMPEADLCDHAEELLTAIAQDLNTEQAALAQSQKSKGLGTVHLMPVSGRLHADGGRHHEFSLAQVLAEFRALRASVLRLYELTCHADLPGYDDSTRQLMKR